MEQDLQARLKAAFYALRNADIVKNQKQFAALLGYTETSMSLALKGRDGYITEKLVARAEDAVRQHIQQPKAPAAPDIIIPAATAKMYADMAESIRILSELVAAQQKGEAAALAEKRLG